VLIIKYVAWSRQGQNEISSATYCQLVPTPEGVGHNFHGNLFSSGRYYLKFSEYFSVGVCIRILLYLKEYLLRYRRKFFWGIILFS
jgi:hypothetical protein